MATKILKLSTGEMILTEVDDDQPESSPYLLIRKPLLRIFDGKGIQLAMWCPFDLSEPTKIYRSQIVGEGPAVEPLANEYRQKFGGIVTAPAGIVTPR